jgi:hypothetical protein
MAAMKYFRKHQKVILACITIGTMFLFVIGDALMATSGGGGGGRQKPGWLRRLFSGPSENAVAVVQGKAYEPEDLHELYRARSFAVSLINLVYEEGENRYAKDALGLSDEDLRDRTKRETKMREIFLKDSSKQEPLLRRFGSLLLQTFPEFSRFGQAFVNPQPEAMLEYLIFKNKADALGITVTPAVVKEDLLALGMNQMTEAEITKILRDMARSGRTNLPPNASKFDDLVNLLVDEVRVAIARQIAARENPSPFQGMGMFMMGGNEPELTPADLWNAYVKVKTSLSVGILPIKVEDYVASVKDPTAEEVKEYFDKFKKEYPDPERDTPGFRIPPMYRVGFLYADMNETKPARKYYNAMVDAFDKLAPATAVAELVAAYNAARETTYHLTRPFLEFPSSNQPNASWVRVYKPLAKLDHAGAAGVIANLTAAFGTPVPLPVGDALIITHRGQAVPPHQTDTLNAAQTTAAALGLAGLPGSALAISGVTLTPKIRYGQEDFYIPFEVALPALADKRYETKAKEYLANDFTEVTNKLNDYAKRYSEWRGKLLRKAPVPATPPLYDDAKKQSLQDYLKQFATARGLEFHETTDLRSRVELLNEPGDKLLSTFIKPVYATERFKTQRDLEEAVKSALVGNELRENGQKPRLFSAFNSSLFNERSHQIALHWVAEASDPRTPDLKEVNATVVKEWKLEKARPLAEQAGEAIMKDVKAAPDNYRKLFDQKGYTPGQTIAEYTEPPLGRALNTGPTYERCPVPAVIDYAPADLVQQCLEKLQQRGDLTVLPNRPKDVYYLFYLTHRTEPKLSDPLAIEAFHNEVIRPSITRQITIQQPATQMSLGMPLPFRQFASQEKTAQVNKAWQDYVKSITNFKEDKAKEYMELLSRRD